MDRDFICQSIPVAIENQDRRLRSVAVSLDEKQSGFNRLSVTIRAMLLVTGASEQASFDARFEPAVQRYSVCHQHGMR